MRRKWLGKALPMSVLALCGLFALMALPAVAGADTLESPGGTINDSAAINTIWVVLAAMVVIFMQAGFALLEIGFSRGKNAGTIVAKILMNFSIAALCYWAVGFAFAFGPGGNWLGEGFGSLIGTDGFFLRAFGDPQSAFGVMGLSDATIESKWFFQFAFAAVSLAIVWGTTLERIKFGVYVIYAIVFASFIYPIASHWVFGGGWLQAQLGMQDFAGSTAVHLIGATGGLAVLLLLGPRRGKYVDGKSRAIPGHNMPMFGLGVLILWLGWFGFNPGSTLGALDGRFAEIIIVTQLAAASGVLMAALTSQLMQKTIDIGMVGNGAIAGLVAITAPSGYVEPWTAPIIGGIAGVFVVVAVLAIDKRLDDPVGALSAHGVAGIWGTLACGIFSSPRLSTYNAFGVTDSDGNFRGGLIYSGSFEQLGVQALGILATFTFVFVLSYGTFWAIKKTYGLRVTDAEEDAGLDIVEHGMYGYPEQFIPASELSGSGMPGTPTHASRTLPPMAVKPIETPA